MPDHSPGAYHPYVNMEMSARATFSHNRTRKAFGSDSERKLNESISGAGVPGPGTYRAADAVKKTFANVDSNRSVFDSGMPQRPSSATTAPSPDAYTPNMTSVFRNVRDGGASMRGSLVRLAVMEHPDHFGGDHSQTEVTVGPGTYEDHMYNTVATSLQKRLARGSKLRPGFGTNTPQRALPYGQSNDSPGPGAYQPQVWAGKYAGRSSSMRQSLRERSRSAPLHAPRGAPIQPATAR